MYRYQPGFFDRDDAAELLRSLLDRVEWRREWLHLYGRRVEAPRLVAWFGDEGLNYRYSGADHRCDGWLPELGRVRKRLEQGFAFSSNLVLLNRYRDGQDSIGWHADDERGHGRSIASVSLGATRRFLIRRPGRVGSERLDLEHGSLLLMDATLRHALPRTRRRVGERVSLTFRFLDPGTP